MSIDYPPDQPLTPAAPGGPGDPAAVRDILTVPAPPDPADDQGTAIRSVAAERFGYGTLLPGQETAISAVLRGKDTLAILPTVGGKSAIYQIASHMTPGATLVVSPLLALQRDQVTSLGHHAVGAAAEMNSTVSRQHREKTFAKLADGNLESLFLAAEQLGHDDVVSALSAATVSPVVVDEAHCVSEWGHDFRPDYLRLGAVIEAMGHPTVVALTATASPPVRDEIIDRLHLRDPAIVVTGFDRPNISLSVETFVEGRDDPGAKREALVERVLAGDGPGIVYCATHRHVDEVAAGLTARGVSAAPYHVGMRTAAREETQESFMGGDVRVIVATTAFGMGIDKADVRFVYHHDISDSVDSYYHEIGRAGRDGEPAEAVLFFAEKDLHLRRFFAGSGGLDNDELARVVELVRHHGGPLPVSALQEALGVSETRVVRMVNRLEEVGALTLDADGTACPGEGSDDPDDLAGEANRLQEEHRGLERTRTDMIRGYAGTTRCRRQYLLAYFGEYLAEPCLRCDTCASGTALVPSPAGGGPFDVGQTVIHSAWGQGVVVRREDEAIVVLFESAGYRTLDLRLVIDESLLEPTG